jgi:hypothetical protein
MTKGNACKWRDAATDGHAVGGDAAGGNAPGDCCDSCDQPRSHDTSRIAWAKLMARVGEEFPLEYPGGGGDIRLIDFITGPGPIRKILAHVLLHTEWRTARASAPLGRRLPKCHWPTYPLSFRRSLKRCQPPNLS